MKKLISLITGILIAVAGLSQTRLAEVEIVKEWKAKKDIQATPGSSYIYELGDDTARYYHKPEGKRILARVLFEDIDTPIPPPPITLYTDTIDDRDIRIKYSGGWQPFNGNAYYKQTAHYNPTASASFTVNFTGNRVQWWSEKRFNHGKATISIYKNTKLLKDSVIDMYDARRDNVRSIVYDDTVKQGQYTMTVVMNVANNVTDYIVIQSTTPITGHVDPVPPSPSTPLPTENTIHVYPGQDLVRTIQTTSPGKTVIIEKGTYTTVPIHVPVGVNIVCNESTINAASAGQENGGIKAGIFNLNSGSTANGNQYIRGCVLDGKNIGYAAIMISNRDNVTIEYSIIQDFTFNGAWFTNCVNGKIVHSTFLNTAWSDPRYLSGAVNIAGVTNMLIQNNKFLSDKNSKGTGIEALWKNTTLTNIKILNNKFDLSHHNPWNGGTSKNFSIELHDTYYRGLEIAYNEFQNEMSLASHKPGNGTKTLIHHNTGNLEGDTYFIETVADDFEIYDNVVSNSQMFAANFQANSTWKNWIFRNNRLEKPAPMPPWGGSILIGPKGVQNVLVEANVLPSPVVKWMDKNTEGGVIIR